MTQLRLYATASRTADPCERKHGGNGNSRRAWRQPGKDTLRQRVWEYVRGRGLEGATLHEACEVLDKPANSLSGRFTELVGHGLLKTAETRPSPSGCPEAVYRVMP